MLERYVTKFGQPAAKQGPNRAEGKVGLAVLFSSNCHTPRYTVYYSGNERLGE